MKAEGHEPLFYSFFAPRRDSLATGRKKHGWFLTAEAPLPENRIALAFGSASCFGAWPQP